MVDGAHALDSAAAAGIAGGDSPAAAAAADAAAVTHPAPAGPGALSWLPGSLPPNVRVIVGVGGGRAGATAAALLGADTADAGAAAGAEERPGCLRLRLRGPGADDEGGPRRGGEEDDEGAPGSDEGAPGSDASTTAAAAAAGQSGPGPVGGDAGGDCRESPLPRPDCRDPLETCAAHGGGVRGPGGCGCGLLRQVLALRFARRRAVRRAARPDSAGDTEGAAADLRPTTHGLLAEIGAGPKPPMSEARVGRRGAVRKSGRRGQRRVRGP